MQAMAGQGVCVCVCVCLYSKNIYTERETHTYTYTPISRAGHGRWMDGCMDGGVAPPAAGVQDNRPDLHESSCGKGRSSLVNAQACNAPECEASQDCATCWDWLDQRVVVTSETSGKCCPKFGQDGEQGTATWTWLKAPWHGSCSLLRHGKPETYSWS
jgi:hypothetical protein